MRRENGLLASRLYRLPRILEWDWERAAFNREIWGPATLPGMGLGDLKPLQNWS